MEQREMKERKRRLSVRFDCMVYGMGCDQNHRIGLNKLNKCWGGLKTGEKYRRSEALVLMAAVQGRGAFQL